ncbi:uncharacterized protein LOC110447284 [Mizuhopecten yessoensis]|uniref:Activated RNA polymerase II transcriptional coactivator p15 n=1 Tax=Mizuhopecten yessoensis TaxID=6573 RepID=A0A210QVN6_MIZYE|nr:uncharacterized protein LOC110447284 [Mizuhopecten yessoensis]OWF52801.1 Activated RNA polymerase II transcriptional coactivator p15 [Mizuhopecten yessoensis]
MAQVHAPHPFVCSYTNDKCACIACQRNIDTGCLRIGNLRGQVSDWYHPPCFWEKCPYKHHGRGTNLDRLTLVELFHGFESMLSHDKLRLEQEACKPPEKFKRNHRHNGLVASGDHEVSADGGDYELDDNTFDLTNLICIHVFRHNLDVYVSIREYFKPSGAAVAKATKVGICLTAKQWNKVCRKRFGIDSALKAIGDKPTKKKAKGNTDEKDSDDDDEEGQVVFSLSWKRRISIFRTNKEAVVDIRDFSEEKPFKPGNRGITLSKIQWNKVKSLIDCVNCSVLLLSK